MAPSGTNLRPRPTPKKPQSSATAQDSLYPSHGGPSTSIQNKSSSQRQTRGTNMLATTQHREAIQFVSGGMAEAEKSTPAQEHEQQIKTKQPRKTNGTATRATPKGQTKASIARQQKDAEKVLAPTTSKTKNFHRVADSVQDKVNSIEHVQTRERLDQDHSDGTNLLNNAPYRFEENEPPQSSFLLTPPQTETMAAPSHPIQSTSLPTAITGVLPNLKPPDPNNIFDQLKFCQGAAERLMQNIATQSNPGSSQQHAASPDLKSLGPGQLNKPERVTRTKPTNTLPIRGQNQPHRPPVRLSTIPAPHRGDKRPLIVLMGLKGRFNVYRRIRSRIRKIAHNSGIDWTKPWPQVPASEKAMFYQMVRHQVPYMERFDMDWASGKIMAKYATHLRREARHNGELPPDPRYAYLKANSAKRRKDAPRGVRPGIAKDRDQAGPSNDNYDTGPSEASPSSSSVNTAQDEAMMDTPGLFGLEDLHNEGKSGEDFNDGDNENDDDDGNDDGDGDF